MNWILVLMSFSDSFGAMLPFRHDVSFETREQCEAAKKDAITIPAAHGKVTVVAVCAPFVERKKP
jgi:hypothetical protein